MSASGGKADVLRFNFGSLKLNVRFSPKRTFRLAKTTCFEGPLSARSGRSEGPSYANSSAFYAVYKSCLTVSKILAKQTTTDMVVVYAANQ